MGRGEMKENDGVHSTMIYLVYFKNFCKCRNVALPSTTIKKIKNLKKFKGKQY
jgi:hypothetical protein